MWIPNHWCFKSLYRFVKVPKVNCSWQQQSLKVKCLVHENNGKKSPQHVWFNPAKHTDRMSRVLSGWKCHMFILFYLCWTLIVKCYRENECSLNTSVKGLYWCWSWWMKKNIWIFLQLHALQSFIHFIPCMHQSHNALVDGKIH